MSVNPVVRESRDTLIRSSAWSSRALLKARVWRNGGVPAGFPAALGCRGRGCREIEQYVWWHRRKYMYIYKKKFPGFAKDVCNQAAGGRSHTQRLVDLETYSRYSNRQKVHRTKIDHQIGKVEWALGESLPWHATRARLVSSHSDDRSRYRCHQHRIPGLPVAGAAHSYASSSHPDALTRSGGARISGGSGAGHRFRLSPASACVSSYRLCYARKPSTSSQRTRHFSNLLRSGLPPEKWPEEPKPHWIELV
jgi:hypothetical protein